MDVSLGNNSNNLIKSKKLIINTSNKSNISGNSNKGISKYVNNRREIYEKKNLISSNNNNIDKSNLNKPNEYQSPKITYLNSQKNNINNINNRTIKNNYSEINIYNGRNRSNKKEYDNELMNKNNNYKFKGNNNKNNIYNSNNYNADNNTFYTIINSNSNNNNAFENISNKNKNNNNNVFSKNKKEISSNNINKSKISNFKIIKKDDVKRTKENSPNNIINYGNYKNDKEKENSFNEINNVNNSISWENKIKKNINYEKLNKMNSFKGNNNKKENIININKSINVLIFKKSNEKITNDKIPQMKIANNYINKIISDNSNNYKDKENSTMSKREIINSSQNTNEKNKNKYKNDILCNNKNKNLNINNIYDYDNIASTPNNNSINNKINITRKNGSYSDSSNQKEKKIIDNENNYYQNKNTKGRILTKVNDINDKNNFNNIYDFDIPIQKDIKTFVKNKSKNNCLFNSTNSEYINNIIVNTSLINNMLSDRKLKESPQDYYKDNRQNQHSNYFININIKNRNENKILNRSNDIGEMRKNQMGSPKIYKKKIDSKNRQFIYRKDRNNEKDIILSKKMEFKKEIRDIYNEQKKNSIEYIKLNNFDQIRNSKNIIKPPIIIDENKNEQIIYKNDKINNFLDDDFIPLIKPVNKNSYKNKFYCYNIKYCQIKKCYFTKSYISKNIKKGKDKKLKYNMNNMNMNNHHSVLNDENQDMIFTEKIPAHIDNAHNANCTNSTYELIENSSFKDRTSNFKAGNELKSYNSNSSYMKMKENMGKINKLNLQKNNIKEELEMTFGIEDNYSQSKFINNNNQFDINDFSTINNNTNHSIVINENVNNNNLTLNERIKLNEDEESIGDDNQNDDVKIVSEDEIKKEDKNSEKDENKKLITEGKEIKILGKIEVKRKTEHELRANRKIFRINEIEDDTFNKETEKNNNIYKDEFFDDDISKKKTNTYKIRKSNRLFEKLNNNLQKCENLNDVLTRIFDRKAKSKDINYDLNENNIRSKTPVSNRNINDNYENPNSIEKEKDNENENNDENLFNEINKKNTYNPKKMLQYEKIFKLKEIKNLEDLLNKKNVENMVDIVYKKDIDDEADFKRQSVSTYNKKLEKRITSKFFEENEENNDIDIMNKTKKIEDKNIKRRTRLYHDTPKFYNDQKGKTNKIFKNKKIYSYDEIISFKESNILCSGKNFLSEEFIAHCNEILNFTEKDEMKSNLNNKNESKTDTKIKNEANGIEQWSRKDMSKEIKEAEEYMKKMKIEMSKDNFKFQIIEILNTITVDNYEEVLNKISAFIYEINNINENNNILHIKPEILLDNQCRFAEIIIDKAIMEKGFVKLYARLCNDLFIALNRIIDNCLDINIKNKLINSENLISLLIVECKQRLDDYIYNNDENEESNDDYLLIKKKFLGNIDFIAELINVKLFSQKIGFDFLDIMYRKFTEKENNDKNKYLNLEGVITLLNKFGKTIFEWKNEKYLQNLNNYINDYIIPTSNNKDIKLPGYIKYKLINLIEKQKNNWEESLYEKSISSKGKNDEKK